MATQHNFRIKNGLEVAGTERISSSGVITGSLTGSLASATTATTQSASDNSTKIATTAYTDAAITALVDSSPGALNTLNELAAALGDDASFSTTVTNSLAAKLPLAGGTMTGDLGINQAASGYGNLTVGGTGVIVALRASSGAGKLGFYEAGAGRFYLESLNGSNGIKFMDGDGTTEHMRIKSDGKVGIGTAAPDYALHIKGTGHQRIKVEKTDAGGDADISIAGRSDSTGWVLFTDAQAGANSGVIKYVHNGDYMSFRTNGTDDRMRITSNGNVGIGTNNPLGKLSVGAGSINDAGLPVQISTGADGTQAWYGVNRNGGYGALFGYSASSTYKGLVLRNVVSAGTANADGISFMTNNTSMRMHITGDGKVGIGTSSPQALLDVTVPNAKTANAGVWGYLGKTNEASGYQALQCFQIGGSAADERRYEFQTIEQGVSNNGSIVLQKSGGRVFIGHGGADGNADKLVVAGSIGISNDAYIGAGSGFGPSNGAGSSGTIQLYSSSTGNMTLSANFANADTVFNMSGNTKFEIKRSASGTEAIRLYTLDGGMKIGALNGSYHHFMRVSGPSLYYFDNAAQASGGFSTYSDERLKEEITPVTGALDSVAKMNGVTFKWKDAAKRGGGDSGKQFGVLAQNMLTVDSELPKLNVDPLETQENIDDDSKDTDYYSMDYSRLTPYFIEAIKELKTKLEAAEARIATLEG